MPDLRIAPNRTNHWRRRFAQRQTHFNSTTGFTEERAMPRPRSRTSIDDIVLAAVEGVVKRASAAIARAIAEVTAERLDRELATGVARARGRRAGRGARSRPRTEITRWAADRRARRVPTFVIEQTGLKTKKQIVAKFGEGVVFEKGKPTPKPR